MITFIRTATLMPGEPEARAWASEIGSLVARITGNQVRVGMPVGGNPAGICWIVQYESLAQLEEHMAKWVSNPEFQAMGKRQEGLIVPGSVNDQIYQTN